MPDAPNRCEIPCSCGVCSLRRFPEPPDELPPTPAPSPSVTLVFNHALTVSACVFGTTVNSGPRIAFDSAQLVL